MRAERRDDGHGAETVRLKAPDQGRAWGSANALYENDLDWRVSSLISMRHAHINAPMDGSRNRNIFGAFALMISDDIVRATSSRAPEAGPTASALALLAHEPGLSIRTLAIGVGLSHAGAVRLVDRLATEGLVERRGHATDGRARSLYLTAAGRRASAKVLNARDQIIAEGLSVLSDEELVILGALSERVLRARLQGFEHAYRVCRLCCHDACDDCPVDAELRQRVSDSGGVVLQDRTPHGKGN